MPRWAEYRKGGFLGACLAVVLVGIAMVAQALPVGQTPTLLVINSYHKGYPWTDEQSDAIEQRLREAFPGAWIDVVYLDWKRHPDQSHLDAISQLLQRRYQGQRIDGIVTTDDAALSFALPLRESLAKLSGRSGGVSPVPVVSSGVFEESARKLAGGQAHVTGATEVLDPEGTIALARRLNPHLRDVYLIHDSSETSEASESAVAELFRTRFRDLRLHVLRDLSFEEVQAEISNLPNSAVALLASYARDAYGRVLPPERFAALFSQASRVPVYTMYGYLLGTGVLGGSLLSGDIEGMEAAELMIGIISGGTTPDVPWITAKPTFTGVDHKVMERFSLDERALLRGTRIVNKPATFVETYPELVAATSSVFAVLVTLLVLLANNIRRRRAVEERLRLNYEQLLASREELSRSEERYRLASESARDVIWEWDIVNDERKFSARMAEIVGPETAEIGTVTGWIEHIHPDDRVMVQKSLDEYLQGQTGVYRCTYRMRCDDGGYVWLQVCGAVLRDAAGKPYWMVGSYSDVTEATERQRRNDYLAYHDGLTDLPNRVRLAELVDQAITAARTTKRSVTLVFVDLDNFKYINDSFGHKTGDDLLVAIARRLETTIGEGGVVGRLGGDEFVMMIGDAGPEAVGSVEQQIKSAFAFPFLIDGEVFYISCSAGAAIWPEDGGDFGELLKNADAAMYRSKAGRQGSFVRFRKEMSHFAVDRVRLHNRLRFALKENAFSLYFQPQVDAVNGSLRGFEALLRWHDAELGNVPPDRFIPACEETGLIVPLGIWVLEQACAMAAAVNRGRRQTVLIGVNVSVVQLMRADFVECVREVVDRAGLPRSFIELEITESLMLDAMETGIARLRSLVGEGFKIALDDFGTGYSSLNYLRLLPTQVVKLDKAFISRLPENQNDVKLVSSIINIARDFGLEVIAEGVERPEQRQALSQAGCHWLQGYMISRPMPADQVASFMANWPGFETPEQ